MNTEGFVEMIMRNCTYAGSRETRKEWLSNKRTLVAITTT